MKKKVKVIELQHLIFGRVRVTSAGRCDSGHYLLDEYQRRLLTDSKYWQEPQKAQMAFDELFAPIYREQLRLLRRGSRYDLDWRWRRSGGRVRPVESEEPIELSSEPSQRDALDDVVSLEEADDLAALTGGSVDHALAEIQEVAA